MSTVNATLDVGDDTAGVIAGLISRFPKGRRVRLAISEEPLIPTPVPSLDQLRSRLDDACLQLAPLPWATSEEALNCLREGDRD